MVPSRQPTSCPTMRPSTQPSSSPSCQPTGQPSMMPSGQPTSRPSQPSSQPTRRPSGQPSGQPSMRPSGQPSGQPTMRPSTQPTGVPSSSPSALPSGQPSMQPSSHPSSQPSAGPTRSPSSQPSMHPTSQPSVGPTSGPTSQPSSKPSQQPSSQPSSFPSAQPSAIPSGQPSLEPSSAPTMQPSSQPSSGPTGQPTLCPTEPSSQPTTQPSGQPSNQPSGKPSGQPTTMPTCARGSYLELEPDEEGRALNFTNWDLDNIWVWLNQTYGPVRKLGRDNECAYCPPGYYSNDMDDLFCEPSPIGYYTSRPGMTAPESCKDHYPFYSAVPAQSSCNGYYANISDSAFWVFTALFSATFLSLICLAGAYEKVVALFFFNVPPALDLLSDIQYIVTTPFYRPWVFYFCVAFVFLPSLSLVALLLEKGAPCCLFKLYPGEYEADLRCLKSIWSGNFQDIELGRLFTATLLLFWILGATLLWSPVFAIGAFLYQTKVIAIKRVWDFWVYFWTLETNYKMEDFDIDTKILNESLFSELCFETLPQIALQFYNSTITGNRNSIEYFSLTLSFVVTVNGLYTFGYYYFYEGKTMAQIPTKTAILVFLQYELETNDQIEKRKDLVSYLRRLKHRGVRIMKYEKQRDIRRYVNYQSFGYLLNIEGRLQQYFILSF